MLEVSLFFLSCSVSNFGFVANVFIFLFKSEVFIDQEISNLLTKPFSFTFALSISLVILL